MKIQNYITKALIILSGVFYYQIVGQHDRFFPAQFGFFVFIAGILGSLFVFKLNKWMGCLVALCSFGFFKTYLLQHAPEKDLYYHFLVYSSIFMIYCAIRYLKPNKKILKLFFIPVFLNAILIIVQFFDNSYLSFMPVKGVGGFLGNSGIVSCYLAMTTPIFLQYFRKGIPFLFIVLILCKSFTGIIVFGIVILFYLFHQKRKSFKYAWKMSVLILLIFVFFNQGKISHSIHIRASNTVGTFDGIMYNPTLGWGLGSYESIMMQAVSDDKMMYLGLNIANPIKGGLMHRPHNELLFGWWNFGILFPIFIILLIKDLIYKFTKEKILPAAILIAGGVCSLFYFLSPPTWFLMILSLGIYENKGE